MPRVPESRGEARYGAAGPPERLSEAAEANHNGFCESKGGVTWAFKDALGTYDLSLHRRTGKAQELMRLLSLPFSIISRGVR